MPLEIKIKKVENGYILSVLDEDRTNYTDYNVIEIEEPPGIEYNEARNEQLALRRVFWELQEFFGVYNDKHANAGKGQRMTIEVDND